MGGVFCCVDIVNGLLCYPRGILVGLTEGLLENDIIHDLISEISNSAATLLFSHHKENLFTIDRMRQSSLLVKEESVEYLWHSRESIIQLGEYVTALT